MKLGSRSNQMELLDGNNIPFEDIRRNMQELNVINTWLGGHRITIQGLQQIANNHGNLHVCEIGCGGGDNILALQQWCNSRQLTARFTGIDMKPACIHFAKSRTSSSVVHWITSDYRDVVFDEPPDIIFSSLFCHHFTDNELAEQLRWMQANARLGFFINDLQRHPVPYFAIKWLTAAFSTSYLIQNDAPLSVARSFTRSEWIRLMQQAGITNYSIQWKWAFRYLICYQHD